FAGRPSAPKGCRAASPDRFAFPPVRGVRPGPAGAAGRRAADTKRAVCSGAAAKQDRLLPSGNLASRRRDVTEETAAPVSGATDVRDAVTVRMPADSAYLSALRTATAGLAARLDFTLDEIEDLRIGVDEACAMLLAQALPGTDLTKIGRAHV